MKLTIVSNVGHDLVREGSIEAKIDGQSIATFFEDRYEIHISLIDLTIDNRGEFNSKVCVFRMKNGDEFKIELFDNFEKIAGRELPQLWKIYRKIIRKLASEIEKEIAAQDRVVGIISKEMSL